MAGQVESRTSFRGTSVATCPEGHFYVTLPPAVAYREMMMPNPTNKKGVLWRLTFIT
jgi:hypothetical protein